MNYEMNDTEREAFEALTLPLDLPPNSWAERIVAQMLRTFAAKHGYKPPEPPEPPKCGARAYSYVCTLLRDHAGEHRDNITAVGNLSIVWPNENDNGVK